MKKIYTAGIYARLSVEQGNSKDESIETQLLIGKAFLKNQPDIQLYQCYTDLGKTGTNFDRDGWKCLMEDIRCRRVDCVIVKDFSRFGRNYLETGNYIQKIFPFLGVRFISVTDQFDSLYVSANDFGVTLKSLVNELYAKDIAARVGSAAYARWSSGIYTGGRPPYGYMLLQNGKNRKLVPASHSAEIIQNIYHWYKSGESIRTITTLLYGQGVHRPSECEKYGHIFQQQGEELLQWSYGTVRGILLNPIYTGCLVRKDGGIMENTHECIIERPLFDSVGLRFSQTKKKKVLSESLALFEKIIFCGECGGKMAVSSHITEKSKANRKKIYAYFCRKSERMDHLHCERKYITEECLTTLLTERIRQEMMLAGNQKNSLMELEKQLWKREQEKLLNKISQHSNRIEEWKRRAGKHYMLYRAGKTGQSSFVSWKAAQDVKIQNAEAQLRKDQLLFHQAAAEQKRLEIFLQSVWKPHCRMKWNQDFAVHFIERITVYPDKRLVILFRFQENIDQSGKEEREN